MIGHLCAVNTRSFVKGPRNTRRRCAFARLAACIGRVYLDSNLITHVTKKRILECACAISCCDSCYHQRHEQSVPAAPHCQPTQVFVTTLGGFRPYLIVGPKSMRRNGNRFGNSDSFGNSNSSGKNQTCTYR